MFQEEGTLTSEYKLDLEKLADEITRAIATAKICKSSVLYVTKGKKLNRCNICLTALEKFLKSIKGRHNHYNHVKGLVKIHRECHDYHYKIPSCLLDMIPNPSDIIALFLLSEVEKMVNKFNKARTKQKELVHIINITRKIKEYLEILCEMSINHPAMAQMQSIAADLDMQFVLATATYSSTTFQTNQYPA